MKEKELFLSEFYKDFQDIRFHGKKVMLYGTGFITKWVIDNWGLENEFMGVCDFNYPGIIFEGYKVIKEKEIKQVEAFDCLIIMNRNPIIAKSICRRIYDTLPENVLVVDVHGQVMDASSLHSSCSNKINDWESVYTHAEISQMLKNSDIVSFDVFDTLMTRTLPDPIDLFYFLSYEFERKYGIVDFLQRRREAEYLASHRKLYPTLEEIYKVLVTELMPEKAIINDGLAKTFCMEEIWAEKYFIKAKTINVNFLSDALREGKEIYIISDTFFTKDVIIELMLNAGINCIKHVPLDHFLLSCEMKASKADGKLWDIFKTFLKGKNAIHIGDDLIADINNSEKAGIQTVHIPSSRQKWNELKLPEHKDILSVIQQGILQNGLLNNDIGCRRIKSFYDYGYYIIGPLVFNYLLWILRAVTSKGGKTVYFFSRDGFFLQKLFNQISQEMNISINGEYLYLSRSFLEYLCLNKEEWSKIRFSGKVKELLKYRFNIECKDEEMGETFITPDDDIMPYVEIYIEEIERRRTRSRALYREYCENMRLYNQKNEIHIVDPSYKGTCQYLLSKFLSRPTEGYYCYADLSENNTFYQNNMHAFYQEKDDKTGIKSILWLYHMIFEASIMVSPEGSVLDIEDRGFVFTPLGITQKNFQNKWDTYTGIKNYFLNVIETVIKFELTDKIIPNSILPVHIFERVMNNTFEVATEIKKSIYTDNYYDNIFGGRSVNW